MLRIEKGISIEESDVRITPFLSSPFVFYSAWHQNWNQADKEYIINLNAKNFECSTMEYPKQMNAWMWFVAVEYKKKTLNLTHDQCHRKRSDSFSRRVGASLLFFFYYFFTVAHYHQTEIANFVFYSLGFGSRKTVRTSVVLCRLKRIDKNFIVCCLIVVSFQFSLALIGIDYICPQTYL